MHRAIVLSLVFALGGAVISPPAHARQILVVDLSQADVPTQLLVASIQGVVNRDPSQVAVYTVSEPADAAWLALYPGEIVETSVQDLLARVRERLAGQVLYDPAETHSLNLAAAAAALLDAALTPSDLGLETVFDARGRWADRAAAYRYAVAQVLREAAPDRAALLGPSDSALRDYLARERILAVDLDWRDAEQAAVLREILGRLQPGSMVFGSPELTADDDLLNLLAQWQHVLIPVSRCPNLSFHCAHPATAPLRQLERLAPLAYQTMVTFVYEGGADLGFALGPMRELWQDPARGAFPLGWTVAPALLELAPAVMQSYYADSWRSAQDELVLAPNGAGYFVPSRQGEWGRVLERMARWTRVGDLRVAAVADRGAAADLEPALAQYQKAGVRGLLLGPGARLQSGLYGGVPAVVQAVRATSPYQALQAIREAAQKTKYIYVSVDPLALTPTQIASIVARLGPQYLVLRPREFLEVARQTTATGAQKPGPGAALISDITLRPAAPGALDETEVRATVRSRTQLDSVRAVYSATDAPGEWSALLQPGPEDRYSGTLPPRFEGGKVTLRVRAVDTQNGVTWSDPVTFEVAAPDGDRDGLSDALEQFARTDPAQPDTDGDGWRDGNDAHPLMSDYIGAVYLGPLAAPSDAPYIIQGEGAVDQGVRAVSADEQAVYVLPLDGVPEAARAMVHAVVGGDYRVEASADGKQWQDIGSATGDAPLAAGSWEIPADYLAAGRLYLRLSDATPDGGAPARISELSVVAHPDGPSVSVAGTAPQYPAVGTPITVLASVFDPEGIAAVHLHYRINAAGTVTVPMSEQAESQTYAAQIHGALNGDIVTYWVSARDSKQHPAASRPQAFRVGTAAQETISLVAGRDFEGDWEPGVEWGASRWSPHAGATDQATINITGGAYRVWILAAPRGAAIRVTVEGREVGAVDAMAHDGWQSLGTVDLGRGRHVVRVVAADEGRCGYAQVLFTRDRTATPPAGMVCDLYNTIAVLAPRPEQTVSGVVEIAATGTGNIGAVECYVDGARIAREEKPVYRFRWNARRAAPGRHDIELRALDHAGNVLLTSGLAVEVAR